MSSNTLNRRSLIKFGFFAFGTGLAASYPVFIERYLIQVNKYTISLPRLPKVFDGFTIVHLTDLHYGFLVSLSFIRNVIGRANSIPRDITVCTGDYIHEKNAFGQIDTVWPELMKLNAPSGVLSVLGNHDHWGDTDRSLYWLKKSGQDIRHKKKRFIRSGESLWIMGAGDFWEDHIDIDHLVEDIPSEDCRIVLAHNPDSADTIHRSTADLVISGHTHGGQVNLPFVGTPVLPVNNKNYSFGLKKSVREFPVFISRGIGWAIYPVRFNCYPEIAVLELKCC